LGPKQQNLEKLLLGGYPWEPEFPKKSNIKISVLSRAAAAVVDNFFDTPTA
jgi:hypothetical protein